MRPALLGLLPALLLGRACAGPATTGSQAGRPTWTGGNKQGLGTSAGLASKVWFTLGQGALNEVYYPSLEVAQTRLLELAVVDAMGRVERETLDARHAVSVPDPEALLFEQVNSAPLWRVFKRTVADPERAVVVQRVRFEPQAEGLRLLVLFDPSLGNGGLGDRGQARAGALLAAEGPFAVALTASSGFRAASTGLLRTSRELGSWAFGALERAEAAAGPGDVAQVAELALPASGPAELTLALGFGADGEAALAAAQASLVRPYREIESAYASGWRSYLAPLRRAAPPYAETFAMAAMVLKAHEDKTTRGAMVASLTVPWGEEVDARPAGTGGYHLVWSRDLYHVALAFQAMGDEAAAERALDYLFRVQQRRDGSLPQNSWLDGRPYWPSLQLDEVAYPLILAHELKRLDAITWRRHVRPAADFILRNGPATPQERWEEEPGYSPSTLAAEIAGLVCAAAIAEQNGDAGAAARYRARADAWSDALEGWTVTRSGPLSRYPYFLRVSQRGRPDSGQEIELNNGAGRFDERAIVDAGFLELVRLGIRAPDDALVARSLEVVDRTIRVATPHGPGWYRYNHDGYGEKPDGGGYDGTGVGRLWPLLTGERGEYELANGRDARPYLDALMGFATEARLLPEQVWDRPDSPRPHLRFGEGTGSATPLAWAEAQFIRLALSIEEGRVVGQPKRVAEHFARRRASRAAHPD